MQGEKRRSGLSSKIISLIIIIGVIPLVCMGIVFLLFAQSNVRKEVEKANSIYLEQTKSLVAEFYNSLESETKYLSTINRVINGIKVRETNTKESEEWNGSMILLNNFANEAIGTFGYEQIFITDVNGIIIFDSMKVLDNLDNSSKEYLRKSLKGILTFSEPYYSEYVNKIVFTVSVPVYENTTEKTGLIGTINILISQMNLQDLILDGLETLGISADAYLIDETGLLLTNAKFGDFSKDAALNRRIQSKAVDYLKDPIIQNDSSFKRVSEYIDYMGNAVLGSLSSVRLGTEYAGLIIEIDSDEAFADMNYLRNLMIVLIIVIGIFGIVAGVLTARSITRPVMRIVRTLNEGAEQVTAASEQLSNASQQLAEASSEQASGIEETAATLNQSSSMIQQTTENTNKASSLTAKANKSSAEGKEEMVLMMKSMEEIKSSSDEISKIVKVIDEIAFQTNILSLNAAVEAARAGKGGAGFAVVAQEVRNLAQRSAQAAKGTSSIIDNNIQLSEQGIAVAKRLQDKLTAINAQVTKVSNLVDEINSASGEQSQGISQINSAISQMEQATQQNAATAEESASASEELNAQAESVREAVLELSRVINGRS